MRSPRLARHSFDHLNSVRFKLTDLVGIVREQTDAVHPECSQGGGGETVIPRIGGESQVLICFHSIHTPILQLVSAQFIHEPDTTALLRKIKKKTRAGGGDLSQRQLQLSAAVAALRSQDVARKALGMNANQGDSSAIQASAGKDDRALLRFLSLDSQDCEAPVLRG